MEDDEEEFHISEDNLSDDLLMDEEDEEDEEEDEEEEEEMERELEKQWNADEEAAAAKKHVRTKQSKKKSSVPATIEELPIVDVFRFQLKKRIFTEDRIDSSAAAQDPAIPRVCAFCHRGESDVLGGFVSPHPFVGAKGFVFVHRMCVLSHPEVARSATRYFNVIKAVNASKKLRCHHCNAFGATLCCAASGCLK